MNHLSDQELFEYLDGRSGASQGDVSRHIAVCEQCRATIALHGEIRKQAAHARKDMLPANFTKRIMRNIQVPRSAPRFAWLAENSANMFAMVFVVGIVGLIIYTATLSSPEAADSVYSRQFALWHDAYASVMNAVAAHNRQAILPAVSGSTGVFGPVFWTGVAALVVFGFLDKLRAISRTR